jgi:hypothetical protein
MEALQTVTAEKQTVYDRIAGLTPAWMEARDRAERDAHMNKWFNLQERDAFAPIDRLLDQIIEMNILGPDRGE